MLSLAFKTCKNMPRLSGAWFKIVVRHRRGAATLHAQRPGLGVAARPRHHSEHAEIAGHHGASGSYTSAFVKPQLHHDRVRALQRLRGLYGLYE